LRPRALNKLAQNSFGKQAGCRMCMCVCGVSVYEYLCAGLGECACTFNTLQVLQLWILKVFGPVCPKTFRYRCLLVMLPMDFAVEFAALFFPRDFAYTEVLSLGSDFGPQKLWSEHVESQVPPSPYQILHASCTFLRSCWAHKRRSEKLGELWKLRKCVN